MYMSYLQVYTHVSPPAGGRGEFQSSFTDQLADGLACNVSFCTFVEALSATLKGCGCNGASPGKGEILLVKAVGVWPRKILFSTCKLD